MKLKLTILAILLIILTVLSCSCEEAVNNGDGGTNRPPAEQNGGGGGETDQDPNEPCSHAFGEWETVKHPTCSEEGKRVRSCSKCAQAEEEPIQKAHEPVTDAAVAATCKDTGLSEGSHCSLCGEVLVAQAVTPKTDDHTPVTDAAVAATCKDTGLSEGSHCSLCQKVLVEQASVPKNANHSFVSNRCSVCGLTVIEHGNADGSMAGGNNKVKYYVTGDLENYNNFEIVIYGEGEMPNFKKTSNPPWHSYLPYAVKIKIESGITSIGKYTFYCPSSDTACKFIMSDTVKTIRSYAIYLNIKNLTLGKGVETVESDAIGNVNSIYIPRSVKKLYLGGLGNETYFYEGTLEEFYQIRIDAYGSPMTIGEYIATLDEDFISNIHIYLQAKKISDRTYYWR